MDLHRNLFYSYRGPNLDDADRDRQLENNLTKALINTLDLGGEAVWRPFLTELGLPDARRPTFLLQRRDLPSGGAANRRHRVLLGISKQKSAWSPDAHAKATEESVPDAWLYGDGFAVLMESKVSADFLPGQMQAHLARLRPNKGTESKVVLMTWEQMYLFFGNILADLTDASSRLLLTQFRQFLEYSGMTGFTGFRHEHFDYFVMHDDEDARRWIREQVDSFAQLVLANLQRFSPFYEDYDVGNLSREASSCWAAFGPRGNAYRSVTHQSVSLNANGLRVFVNTELKPATDQLKKILTQSANELKKALRAQHVFEPFELVIEERIQRQAMVYDYYPKMCLDSSMLADKRTADVAWRAFEETIRQLPLPYVRLDRHIPRAILLELSRRDPMKAVQHIERILQRSHEVVKLLNNCPER